MLYLEFGSRLFVSEFDDCSRQLRSSQRISSNKAVASHGSERGCCRIFCSARLRRSKRMKVFLTQQKNRPKQTGWHLGEASVMGRARKFLLIPRAHRVLVDGLLSAACLCPNFEQLPAARPQRPPSGRNPEAVQSDRSPVDWHAPCDNLWLRAHAYCDGRPARAFAAPAAGLDPTHRE